jgi:heterodisulfide reductase subunit C
MSMVIGAVLKHLVQSRQKIDDARDELDLTTIQEFKTDVIGLRYRKPLEMMCTLIKHQKINHVT